MAKPCPYINNNNDGKFLCDKMNCSKCSIAHPELENKKKTIIDKIFKLK